MAGRPEASARAGSPLQASRARRRSDPLADARARADRLLERARKDGLSTRDPRFIELCDARDRVETKLLKVRRWRAGLDAARTELERARAGLAAAAGRLRSRLEAASD